MFCQNCVDVFTTRKDSWIAPKRKNMKRKKTKHRERRNKEEGREKKKVEEHKWR